MTDKAVLDETAWFVLEGQRVVELLDTDPSSGLTSAEASTRLADVGPNQLHSEPPPSKLQIAKQRSAWKT